MLIFRHLKHLIQRCRVCTQIYRARRRRINGFCLYIDIRISYLICVLFENERGPPVAALLSCF
jgi:hypothetical protein